MKTVQLALPLTLSILGIATSAAAPAWSSGLATPSAHAAGVTLTIFDGHYAQLFPCWIDLLRKSGSTRAVDVVTLDQSASDFVANWTLHHPSEASAMLRTVEHRWNSVSPVSAPQGKRLLLAQSRSQLWSTSHHRHQRWPSNHYQRVIWSVIQARLLSGEDVLHLDLDALPIKDPWELLSGAGADEMVATADIVSAGGTPAGQILDPGVMLLRSRPETLKAVNTIVDLWDRGLQPSKRHDFSDMHMLNAYVARQGCQWSQLQEGRVHGKCGQLQALVIAKGIQRGSHCGDLEECRRRELYVLHGRSDTISEEMCGAYGLHTHVQSPWRKSG